MKPNVVAQKLFRDEKLHEFNMTDMGLIRTAVSAGGIGAELFWFHDSGYFEEFLGHKSGFHGRERLRLNKISRFETPSNRGYNC